MDGVTANEPGSDIAENAKITHSAGRPAQYRVRSRLSVLVEDPDFLIVDKPAGRLTVPTARGEKDTLLARTLDYLHHRFGRRPSAFVVHRLDRDTSGAVVFARTRPALHFLQELFRRHAIEREYIAIVEGRPTESGRFSAALVADRGDSRRGVARGGEPGKTAVTRYRVVERLEGASLVSVGLETGRTHQIRIHFSSAGHPVLGDRVDGRRHEPPTPATAPRQMLHALRLGFPHPRTGETVRAESPIPEDIVAVLDTLRTKRKAPRSGPGR